MIASVILIVGVMFAMPSTVDVKTQSTAMTILGHWELVIADPQGNVIHYIQADNFPTDFIKNEAQQAIFVGNLASAGSMDFIALGLDDTGPTLDDGSLVLETEATGATGRCDSGTGTATDTAATGGGDATSVRQCVITIDETNDNDTLIEVALFDATTAGNMGSVSTLGASVLLQTGMTIDSTVTFTFGG